MVSFLTLVQSVFCERGFPAPVWTASEKIRVILSIHRLCAGAGFYRLFALRAYFRHFAAGVLSLRARAGYARRVPRVQTAPARPACTGSSICHAISRISHCARLQQRSEKKCISSRAFIVTSRRVAAALGRTKRASSLALSFAPPSFSCQWQYHVVHGVHLADKFLPLAPRPAPRWPGESRSQSRRPWKHSAGSARRTTRF